MVTLFDNIFSETPKYISISEALERIRFGESAVLINKIRQAENKKEADVIKRKLPALCFSGTFTKRLDDHLQEHSGLLVLDFDDVEDIGAKIGELMGHPFMFAVWVSPRGNGVKALVKIADGSKHREHFAALKEIFPDVDGSGVNPSRVCYESFDPFITINHGATPFTRILTVEKIEARETVEGDQEKFDKLVKWLTHKGAAFVSGERNIFIFKLASACCRFGISEDSAVGLITASYPPSNDFTRKECARTIQSAYKANRSDAGTASFERELLVDKTTRREVEIKKELYDDNVQPRDVIFGADVKANALHLFRNGYESVKPSGAPAIDKHYKFKRGELTCFTGIGNYGKSSFFRWLMILRCILYGEKFAVFGPEDNPAEEFYHDLVEIYLGAKCTPDNPMRPSESEYLYAYEFITAHIFYVYPKDLTPSPVYIKERFLELILKLGVDGCVIDPFNQMSHDYAGSGGRSDKYLETVLGDFARFAQANNVYMIIIAHPHKLGKQANGNYPCPDVFDLADGAMWNNKCDNIIVYHRPVMQTEPDNPVCEFHSKKIRRQKSVGLKGWVSFEFIRKSRRYEFDGFDPIHEALKAKHSPSQGITHQMPDLSKFQPFKEIPPDSFWNN